ncbi:hypothetical protein RvY_05523 [Ramazzottius varieornatus]|uniref:Uncharacterized protein n=1 Tax=Ramazzottius varieornatus TaxID=947166 RepID=A0A1D1UVA5_RAMVA|nr:hypothetical protein RvY_05523 [Ramazzottius varieornatus]
MAEVNDLFIRSLRNSTRRKAGVQNGTGLTLSKSQTSPVSQLTSHHLSSAADGAESSLAEKDQHARQPPPDLLANLTPRPPSSASVRFSPQLEERTASPLPVSTPPPKKKRWMPFSSKVTTVPSQLIKEYRTPSNLPQSGRRHSACVNNSPPIESQVRVVPTWFPPSNISKLKREGSFHGETAASRLLAAKKRAQRMALQEQRNSLVGSDNDAGRKSDASAVFNEENSGVAVGLSGGSPRQSTSEETAGGSSSIICPRHARHHHISIPPVPENCEDDISVSSHSSKSRRFPPPPRKPKAMFKFGTLPRSFKVSGRSSPAPSTPSLEKFFKWAPVEADSQETEAGPKSAPPVFRRVKSVNNKKSSSKNSNRNSWHSVVRSDVALPKPEVWFNDENVAPAVCVTCGDVRKHQHLVQISDDLTLTDTRYFIGDNGEEIPERPTILSDKRLSNWNGGKEKWVMDQASSRESSPEYEDDGDPTMATPNDEPFSYGDDSLQRMSDILDGTMSSVRRDINNFGLQDRSMFSKLLDLSDQIRQWKGPRTQRIRSVDSSPVLSHTKITTGSQSEGAISNDGRHGKVPSLLLGASIKSIPEETSRLPRTYSMENLQHHTRGKETLFNGTPFAVRFVDPDVSASQLRSNIHLSYTDLLKNPAKLWSLSSQPGSMSVSSTTISRGTSHSIFTRLL